MCSPSLNTDKNNVVDGCLTKDVILDLKKIWNSNKDTNSKILSDNPKNILNHFRKITKNECSENDNKCIITKILYQLDKVKYNTILDIIYKPFSPKSWNTNPNEWLSNHDIEKVLNQYEKIYTCFKNIGPSPINYDTKLNKTGCVCKTICNFNLKSFIKSKITKISFVFNLDEHDEPGSHWVSLFVNLNKSKPIIYYFDSVGDTPPQQIIKLIDNIKAQGKKSNIDFVYNYNKQQHQTSTTECGMYTLYFIIEMLLDRLTINKIKNNKITDAKMTKLRRVYFNK
jgi:hypothetical protein